MENYKKDVDEGSIEKDPSYTTVPWETERSSNSSNSSHDDEYIDYEYILEKLSARMQAFDVAMRQEDFEAVKQMFKDEILQSMSDKVNYERDLFTLNENALRLNYEVTNLNSIINAQEHNGYGK